MAEPAHDGGGPGRIGWPAVATVVTGLLGWVTTVAVARIAGPRDFADFAVLWALFFGVGGAFAGLQQEVTRSVRRADQEPVRGRTRLLPGLLVLALPGAVLAAVVVASGGTSSPSSTASGVAAVVAGLLALAVLTVVSGVLAARGSWSTLAVLLVADAAIRTGAAVAAAAAGRGDLLPWAVVSGAFAWVPLLALRPVRTAVTAGAADGWGGLVGRASIAMAATACAAMLVTGFPLLVSVARGGEDLSATAGVLLAVLVLVRGPLLVVVYGFRPSLLHAFLADTRTTRSALRWWARLAAAGAVATALAALVGPSVVRVVFGERYATGRLELAVLAAGSVQIAMLVVSGLALVALDRHLASTAGWLAAVLASVALLALVADLRDAVLLAVVLAPAVGLLVHGAGLARASSGTTAVPAAASA